MTDFLLLLSYLVNGLTAATVECLDDNAKEGKDRPDREESTFRTTSTLIIFDMQYAQQVSIDKP